LIKEKSIAQFNWRGNVVLKFGDGKSAPNVHPVDTASIALKIVDSTLQAQETKLEQEITHLVTKARQLVLIDRKGAGVIVRRKKAVEKCLDSRRAARDNVLKLLMNIQSSQTNQELVGALKEGTAALKQLGSDATVKEVEDVMEDMTNQLADAEEVNELIGSALDVSGEVDEFELAEELARLKLDEKEETSTTTVTTTVTATTVTTPVVAQPTTTASLAAVSSTEKVAVLG